MRAWRVALALLVVALPAAAQEKPATPSGFATPAVALEKTRFALGERVFFWIEITTTNGYVIPSSLFTTGRVHVTRPDGTTETEAVGWPIDGMGANAPGDRGWRGGRRLRADSGPGRYVVVFEFAGRTSDARTFTIEDVDVVRRIRASFTFPAPETMGAADAAVTLTIVNDSGETIVFPQRGETSEHVSVALRRPGRTSSYFVPPEALRRAAGMAKPSTIIAPFTWDVVDQMATVRLRPGETWVLRIPVADIMAGDRGGGPALPAGGYEISLHTEIPVLIGSRDGAWKDFAPVLLEVSGATSARRQSTRITSTGFTRTACSVGRTMAMNTESSSTAVAIA